MSYPENQIIFLVPVILLTIGIDFVVRRHISPYFNKTSNWEKEKKVKRFTQGIILVIFITGYVIFSLTKEK